MRGSRAASLAFAGARTGGMSVVVVGVVRVGVVCAAALAGLGIEVDENPPLGGLFGGTNVEVRVGFYMFAVGLVGVIVQQPEGMGGAAPVILPSDRMLTAVSFEAMGGVL